MKKLIVFFMVCSGLSVHAQQKAFIDFSEEKNDLFEGLHAYSLSEIFAGPEKFEGLELQLSELDSVSKYDFSKLINLATIRIEYSFSPESSDAEKKAFREKTKKQIENLAAFSKCPKLKAIIFHIGEQIYVENKRCQAKGAFEKSDYSLQYKRMSKENIDNAWMDFGKELSGLLPGVKLYAYTWGW